MAKTKAYAGWAFGYVYITSAFNAQAACTSMISLCEMVRDGRPGIKNRPARLDENSPVRFSRALAAEKGRVSEFWSKLVFRIRSRAFIAVHDAFPLHVAVECRGGFASATIIYIFRFYLELG